jgi:hypothetical protein
MNSFKNAENEQSKIDPRVLKLRGMSGIYTRHFYNNVVSMDDARYLEIGTWGGSTVCSAMSNNKAKVTCIDNWSHFGGPKKEFMLNFNNFKGNNDAEFIETDCFSEDLVLPHKYNMYLYDGDHSVDSQRKALTHFVKWMDDEFIYIVDDWNHPDVREGTYKGIEECNLKILNERKVRLTWDDTHTPFDTGTEESFAAHQTWWNGIGIFMLKKETTS